MKTRIHCAYDEKRQKKQQGKKTIMKFINNTHTEKENFNKGGKIEMSTRLNGTKKEVKQNINFWDLWVGINFMNTQNCGKRRINTFYSF